MKTITFVLLAAIGILCLILLRQIASVLVLAQTHEKLRSENISMEDCKCSLLVKEASKFYIEVNVGGSNNSVRMLINLHMSTTLLSSNNDLGFVMFDCDEYPCQKYPNETSSYYDPQFVGAGSLAEIKLHLANQSWILENKALMASNYTLHKVQYFGNNTCGVIGLGISGQAQLNFQNPNANFLLSFSNETRGELCFCNNQNQAFPDYPLTKMPVDGSWQIKSQGMKLGNKIVDPNSINIVFDADEDQIICPLFIFGQLVADLNGTTIPIKCQIHDESDFYRATCIYHGEIKDLPPIYFPVDDDQIKIEPMEYILNAEAYDRNQGNFTLNIKASSIYAQYEQNFVTHSFKNYVRLGFSFMKNRVFNFKAKDSTNRHNTIQYYEKFQENTVLFWSGWIFGVALVSCCLIGLVWIIRSRKLKDESSAVPLLKGKDEEIQVNQDEETTLHFNEQTNGLDCEESRIQMGLEADDSMVGPSLLQDLH